MERYNKSNIPGCRQPPPPIVEINDYVKFEIEKVLDSRIRHGRLEYLVHWHEYDINNCTWELVGNLINVKMKVQKFHQ